MLAIDHLNAYFGDHQVLHDITLTLEAGEKLAIVGESGSGKTVLAQALMRLNRSVRLSGSLKFKDEELLSASARRMQQIRGRHMAMVFQEPMSALNPVQKVGVQIAEVYRLHQGLGRRDAWAATVARLREMGLERPEAIARAYPFKLSGGQRQRVMIAAALAGEPELLIADEPTTALDALVQEQILALLNRVQAQKGMALVYISHNLRQVEAFADRVAVMQHGKIIESSVAQQLFRQPQAPYTQLLLNAAPPPKQDNPAPDDSPLALDVDNLAVQVRQGGAWRKRILTLLQPLSLTVRQGRNLGIIGESGSGKTTLARALVRLIDAEGDWSVAGRNWARPGLKALSAWRQDMQLVFQDPFSALNPRMLVGDIIAEPLRAKGRADSEKVAAMLEAVGLDASAAQRWPHEFSGGQRQRIAIARALIAQPKVLLLDEPTSALDVQIQRQILELLQRIQSVQALSLVIISHDLAVIRSLADDVIVLKSGEVVEAGPAHQVFGAPNHPYTQNLLRLG